VSTELQMMWEETRLPQFKVVPRYLPKEVVASLIVALMERIILKCFVRLEIEKTFQICSKCIFAFYICKVN
jgi:hypothetical protein